ncbi:MAG TPA: SUMF1/EgtB/PvdO family nonheme iron enzyme [Ktedonobacterales bacterium]|jgi:formylglycine-generating enzyme required for sulfatase activity
MSDSGPYKIFISYRRDDSQATVDHIYDRLTESFGATAIFMDVDAIPPGYDFSSYITYVLQQCRVVLIVIGPSWPTATEKSGAYAGQPRLTNPSDHVRIETEQALALASVSDAGEPIGDLRLIPLLVQGASMPSQEQLPASLQQLTRFNSATVQRYPQFDRDMQRLIGVIASWIGVDAHALPAATPSPSHAEPPAPADPIADLLARFLPQLRDAFNEQDWPQVVRLADYLQRTFGQQQYSADLLPNEVYMMQGQALMAESDYARAKAALNTVWQRDPLDVGALRAAADARIALGEKAAALPLLYDALTFTPDRAERLPLLRIYTNVLRDVAQNAGKDEAQSYWSALLQFVNEGLQLASDQDADLLALRLEALVGLEHDQEALEAARQLTAHPNATVVQWLSRAQLVWKLADETPTDEVRMCLDAAVQLAPNNSAIITARQQLRLTELGFADRVRKGVTFIIPPICDVPAGDFIMGSAKRRGMWANKSEMPQHYLTLAKFSISRFPVTVAEYACFVETGYRQPQQWPDQMENLDHPVVYVSWEDSVAYAAWLAQVTGRPWRLPTEAEWEKAARWDPWADTVRRYPWGDTFDPSRANTSESRIGRTTAVGSYPSGASPYGAEDMAGNVWEWTHSLYQPYPYTISDRREVTVSAGSRVLRGGSWVSGSRNAHPAYRVRSRPSNRNRNVGFRLVVAPVRYS